MNIGEKIKAIRKSKNMTQTQLGKKINVAGATVTRYENGKITPDLEMAQNIANALGITFKDLINYGEQQSNSNSSDSQYTFDKQLTLLGYKYAGDPAEGYLWIEYPDGTLEVTEKDIEELQNSTLSYLKFKLEELKQKNYEHFRPKK